MRALLFTDVVDSTQRIQALGDERAAALWAEHDRRARALPAEHRGLEIDRSDGFFLLFDDVLDAARFAIALHPALVGIDLAARIGLHVGDVTLRRTRRAGLVGRSRKDRRRDRPRPEFGARRVDRQGARRARAGRRPVSPAQAGRSGQMRSASSSKLAHCCQPLHAICSGRLL